MDWTTRSFQLGHSTLKQYSNEYRKQHGQFLTPPPIARFMAEQLGDLKSGHRILEPALGSGTLICALIDRLICNGQPVELWIDGYEVDNRLFETASTVLEDARRDAALHGIKIHYRLKQSDFVLDAINELWPSLLERNRDGSFLYSYQKIISNPPYFKLNQADSRTKAARRYVKGHTNIYTLFMALSLELLAQDGQASFIVPRSFCSGAYFSAFRQDFISRAEINTIHLFESRQDTFKADSVLQENVIVRFQRKALEHHDEEAKPIIVSFSQNLDDLHSSSQSRRIQIDHFLHKRGKTLFFRLPTTEIDERLIEIFDNWYGTLHKYRLDISTGPVVPFRTKEYLLDIEAVASGKAVPLLWMQHVKPQHLKWPSENGNRPKAQAIALSAQTLLLPAANYVLLRRFSAKEEPRRLVAAPFLLAAYPHLWVGFENHLNYIYRTSGKLEVNETIGLSAFFNSGFVDRYFRIVSGSTQVNAEEIRALPLPSLQSIKRIGNAIGIHRQGVDIDAIVLDVLKETEEIPADFPIVRESRIIWAS